MTCMCNAKQARGDARGYELMKPCITSHVPLFHHDLLLYHSSIYLEVDLQHITIDTC